MPVTVRTPILALGATLAAGATFMAGVARPEDAVGRAISAVLQEQPRTTASKTGREPEGFNPAFVRLSSHVASPGTGSHVAPATGSRLQAVDLGDRISFTGRDGSSRAYVVADIRPLDAVRNDEETAGRAAGSALYLITANDPDDPSAIVRFVMDRPAKVRAQSAPAPHAL